MDALAPAGIPPPAAGPAPAHPLDNPARAALTGPHAHVAERRGGILRYPVDMAPFVALPDAPTATDWDDLALLLGSGEAVSITASATPPPNGWEVIWRGAGVQMVGDGVVPAPARDAVRLTTGDVPEILALIERTKPGPFRLRTIELGTYLGIRRDGALVAMAGERLRAPGWTEVSAVCTDPAHRGQGLATALILAVAAGIRARGEAPFLHASLENTTAIRLYESLGFRLRRTVSFQAMRVPPAPTAPHHPLAQPSRSGD